MRRIVLEYDLDKLFPKEFWYLGDDDFVVEMVLLGQLWRATVKPEEVWLDRSGTGCLRRVEMKRKAATSAPYSTNGKEREEGDEGDEAGGGGRTAGSEG